jgi:hypothetical protein
VPPDPHLQPDNESPRVAAVLVQAGKHPLGAKEHHSTRLRADVGKFKASLTIVERDGGLDLSAIARNRGQATQRQTAGPPR